jgi:hypothetical protein
MTLFFLNPSIPEDELAVLSDSGQLVAFAEVIVIVTKCDRWLVTKDRFGPHGRYIRWPRKGRLLNQYSVITRPTKGEEVVAR